MKDKDLKSIIKTCVRECLQEILAEQYLQGIVKTVVKECRNHTEAPSVPKVSQAPKAERRPNPQLRKELLERMGLNPNDPMGSLFEDTLVSGNKILTSNPDSSTSETEGVEHVSESTMEKAGIFSRNWEKFL